MSSLEDPMIGASIDHYPFDMMEDDEANGRYDWSITVEQRFPLSGIRGQRARAARAEARVAGADAERVTLDVILEAQRAFFMVRERRAMTRVLDEQLSLAGDLVAGTSARYASGTGAQADVLRAEVEKARAEATRRALAAEIAGAEAMLNGAMGRPAAAPIPELEGDPARRALIEPAAARETALARRPELRAGTAEVERAAAEVETMRSMYRPMATIRVGPASTMAEGSGAMLMFGISVPIWRERLRAGLSEAQAMERMAQANLEGMQRMIESEATAARESVLAARTRLDVLEDEVVPRARMAVDAALAAYGAGQTTLVSVIDASRALWEARTEVLMAETALGEAWARFERALGGAERGDER